MFSIHSAVISSRACTLPNRDHPLWDAARIRTTCLDLLRNGRLSVEELVAPVVPFDCAADAYREIDLNPAASVKLAIRYERGTPK
ncbi:MAG: hypothetical protein JXR37_00170 [Kiritimatiellae bacterium]|nr:hypothetical protein [Kiritimatiellia bacterium]